MEIKVRLERDEDGVWVVTCPSYRAVFHRASLKKKP